MEPAQRLAALTRLILAMQGANGAPRTADRAWPLAAELAALMDEAERAEIDLASRLPEAADPAYAAHWAQTLEFLHIVTRSWPDWLAEQGLMNPAARLVALLDAQAAAWDAAPPVERVLAAGTTGGIPAVARLLRVVAAPAERRGGAAGPGHRDVGARLGASWMTRIRRPVSPACCTGWAPRGAMSVRGRRQRPMPQPRRAARRCPAPCCRPTRWRSGGTRRPAAVDGLTLLSPADQQEEAAAIAMVLREALETPGATAALVTPDRDLAGRVATELLRYGVVADDSAGEALRGLAAGGVPAPAGPCRGGGAGAGRAARAAEASAGRGRTVARRLPRGGAVRWNWPVCAARARGAAWPACAGRSTGPRGARHQALLERLEACLEPALRIDTAVEVAPALALAALIEAGERLAATDELPGPSRLWAGEEGEALATRLAEVQAALPLLPDQRHDVLPGLLDAVLEGEVVRSRRALRGRGGTEHPRVFIWGLLEARLQTADVMVLGGLAEGVWPPASDPGAWLSRPMRATRRTAVAGGDRRPVGA